MLPPDYLEWLPEEVLEYYLDAEMAIIEDMARRIAKMGYVTDGAMLQAQKLRDMGAVKEEVLHQLGKATGKSYNTLVYLFEDATKGTLAYDDEIYSKMGFEPVALEDNPQFQRIVRAGLAKTGGTYRNLTRTTANLASDQYAQLFQDALDEMYMRGQSGAFSYQEAIKAGLKKLAAKGVNSIRYPSGRVDAIDVAFRRATLTGINQTALKVQEARLEQVGTDLVEVTAHAGARTDGSQGPKDHAFWQGKVYSYSGTHPDYPGFREATGYGTGEGLGGWNCRHGWYPYFEGLSEVANTRRQLEGLNRKTVTVDGKEMDYYDATQLQRKNERMIRLWKREKAAMEAAGLDSGEATKEIRHWQAQQRALVEEAHLQRDYFRERAGAQNWEIVPENAIIKAELKATGVRGRVSLPPKAVEISTLQFDDAHTNLERRHGVSEAEAKGFIQKAVFSTSVWRGKRENYYSLDGVAYVDTEAKRIRTAYKPAEYDDYVKKLMEVMKKHAEPSE